MATVSRKRSGFGDILRAELDRQDVSTRELARRLTVDHPEKIENMRRTLIRYIRGENAPGKPARQAIADALSVDAEVFAQEAVNQVRRDKVLNALAPLADVLLELAVEVARERDETE